MVGGGRIDWTRSVRYSYVAIAMASSLSGAFRGFVLDNDKSQMSVDGFGGF